VGDRLLPQPVVQFNGHIAQGELRHED
jgi:hypothetical protein